LGDRKGIWPVKNHASPIPKVLMQWSLLAGEQPYEFAVISGK